MYPISEALVIIVPKYCNCTYLFWNKLFCLISHLLKINIGLRNGLALTVSMMIFRSSEIKQKVGFNIYTKVYECIIINNKCNPLLNIILIQYDIKFKAFWSLCRYVFEILWAAADCIPLQSANFKHAAQILQILGQFEHFQASSTLVKSGPCLYFIKVD